MNRVLKGAAVAMAAITLLPGSAGAVTLSPADINGGDTSRTVFTDGSLTLTPLIGVTPSTFNDAAARLGNDDNGTNAGAFNDPDVDASNLNDERLQFLFSPLAGLTQITYDYSRVDGPLATDGVSISGFLSDPGASLSGESAGAFDASSVSYDALSGTVNLQADVSDYGGPDTFLNFANPGASAGQTLLLQVHDSTQGGAQFAITSISYGAVPEPTSLLLGVVGILGLVALRNRSLAEEQL